MKILLLILFASGCAWSQCPTLSISGPSGVPQLGEVVKYRVSVGGTDLSKLVYRWSVSSGEILRGQGTPEVEVSSPKTTITASVEVLGFPPGCVNQASESVSCGLQVPQPELIGEIRTTSSVRRIVKELAIRLRSDPTAHGYVVVYGDNWKSLRRTVLKAWPKLLSDRLLVVKGGGSATRLSFWSVPAGANNPAL